MLELNCQSPPESPFCVFLKWNSPRCRVAVPSRNGELIAGLSLVSSVAGMAEGDGVLLLLRDAMNER